MKLKHGLNLAYCTNIHRGESWDQVMAALQKYTLALKQRLVPDGEFGIGLRLGHQAAEDLSQSAVLKAFQTWLERNHCYVFTINGFPYGHFHGRRVKEQVYAPDWTTPERLDYTNRLFDILGEIVPEGVEGSVSTVPVSFKPWITGERSVAAARENLWECIEHIEKVSRRTGKTLHLGLEPEPMCFLETSEETVHFIEQMRQSRPGDLRLDAHLGVNYDCCHLAVEFERPAEAIGRFLQHRIRISKLHFSNALRVKPTSEARQHLRTFLDDVYLHQVVAAGAAEGLRRYLDLDAALLEPAGLKPQLSEEWRIHFHVPLYSGPETFFDTTSDHVLGVMDELKAHPGMCSHIEIETYTWEVLPQSIKQRNVVDQLESEYRWTLHELVQRGLAE